MARIVVNGKNVTVGRSVVISGGKVIVDGTDITPDTKEISITVEGDVESLDVEACGTVQVNGNTGPVRSQAGNIRIGGDVHGDVKSQAGSIVCGNVSGNVKTLAGSITHRR